MERWTGVVNVSLNPTGPLFRVAASLLLLSHSKTLNVPSLNAVFFNGDRVEGTGDPVVERLSEPASIARSLVAKFGAGANAWVVTAPTFAGPFAVYRDFVPSVNSRGDPTGYDPDGFPASTALAKLLSRSVEEVKSVIWNDQREPIDAAMQAPVCPSSTAPPKTVVLGFSKGGSVVNQIISELAYLKLESAENLNIGELSSELSHESQGQICPQSVDSLLSSISEFHYVDVGLNCRGAYITNRDVIRKAAQNMLVNKDSARFVLHGTPRQWCNQNRPWICEEKDLLLHLLKEEACKYEGKLQSTRLNGYGVQVYIKSRTTQDVDKDNDALMSASCISRHIKISKILVASFDLFISNHLLVIRVFFLVACRQKYRETLKLQYFLM